MMRLAILFAAAALFVRPLTAMGGEQKIVLPGKVDAILIPASGLHLRALDPENHGAKFDGPVMLSGTYYYGALAVDDGEGGEHAVYFIPDKATAARLPRFQQRGQPDSIFIDNANAFAKAVIAKDTLAQFRAKNTKYVTGRIDIWVDHFEMGIECDAPYFNAHFLRVAQPPLRVALGEVPDVGC